MKSLTALYLSQTVFYELLLISIFFFSDLFYILTLLYYSFPSPAVVFFSFPHYSSFLFHLQLFVILESKVLECKSAMKIKSAAIHWWPLHLSYILYPQYFSSVVIVSYSSLILLTCFFLLNDKC